MMLRRVGRQELCLAFAARRQAAHTQGHARGIWNPRDLDPSRVWRPMVDLIGFSDADRFDDLPSLWKESFQPVASARLVLQRRCKVKTEAGSCWQWQK